MLSLWFLKVHTLAGPSSWVDDIVYIISHKATVFRLQFLKLCTGKSICVSCFGHSLLTLGFFQYL